MDCCNTLMAHYGISAPVWIDHTESITMALETRSQTIRRAQPSVRRWDPASSWQLGIWMCTCRRKDNGKD
jgi:hypothetical protein